jgi:hypothetical protein
MTGSIKISELSAATTPLTGAETVALVQSGVTKKATVTQIGTVAATDAPTARTLANRFADVVNVKDFGAVGDGVTNDLAAFQLAINAVSSGATITIPGTGNYILTGSLTYAGKFIFWSCAGCLINSLVPSFNLEGVVEVNFGKSRRVDRRSGATSTDIADVNQYRNANYTGGTYGFVNSGFLQTVDVSAGAIAFEWGLVSIINNSATAGENLAIYGQGNKLSTGPTWAGVFEATDKTGTANPIAGLVGIEVNVFANGTDTSGNRVGVDIVVGKGVSGGVSCDAGYAVRILPANSDSANGKFYYGLYAVADKNYFSGLIGVGKVTPEVDVDAARSGTCQMRVFETDASVDTRIASAGGASLVGIIGTYSNHPLVLNVNTVEKVRVTADNLEVTSTTGGVLFPRMTTVQRDAISSPANGLVLYNTTTNKLQVRAAGVWVDLH